MLYQLSYSRLLPLYGLPCNIPKSDSGESRIRTYEGIRQQIYSLPQLAALVSPHYSISIIKRTDHLKDPCLKNGLQI
jgi:hypothetical protein